MSIRVNDFSNLIISNNIKHISNMMFKDVDIEIYDEKLTTLIIRSDNMVHIDDEKSPYYATIICHDNSIEGFHKLNECMKKLKSEGRISRDAFIAYNDLGIDNY